MLKNVVCSFVLFALFAGFGQVAASQGLQDKALRAAASQEFQCLANAEVCIDVAITFAPVQETAASNKRYYVFTLDSNMRLGAPANSHRHSHWSIDSDYILGKDIVIQQLRYTKYKNAPNTQAAEISVQGEQRPGRTGAAACAGLGAYLSGTCAVRPTGTPVIVPNKSLYITADSEDSLHLESSDPDFIELLVFNRNTHLEGGSCASCLKRIEWYIQKDSREERFFDKLFANDSFSRYSIQIAASGQTP